MAKILVIDDELDICTMLKEIIGTHNHRVDYNLTIRDGFKHALSESYDIVFLDVNLPDGSGLDYLTMIKSTPSNPEIIIITGKGSPDGAETAIRNGVWDYLRKPFSKDDVTQQLMCILQYREEKENEDTAPVLKREGIIGESTQIKECLKLVAEASLSDINVLITGETGTGKERFAAAIHDNSRRSRNNLVIVDCAALPETLVESTLFGHVKGAFTGADRDHEGLIKQADGGTLFLDEIGELPMSIQKAFLRVLQEHAFRPVGGKKFIHSDFRLVAATNRNLSRMIEEGTFREDLFFRIKSMKISLPPLRGRPVDIKELTMYYILKICEREGLAVKGFSSQFIDMLEAYDWPGNVRELINAIEWAINKARYETTLFPKHLPEQIRINVARASMCDSFSKGKISLNDDKRSSGQHLPTYKKFREEIILRNEKDYLCRLLSSTNGNIDNACIISGLGRTRLYGLIKNHKISRTYSCYEIMQQ